MVEKRHEICKNDKNRKKCNERNCYRTYKTIAYKIRREESKDVIIMLISRHWDMLGLKQQNGIAGSRNNARYDTFQTIVLPRYLSSRNKYLKTIARFSYGNKEKDNKIWLKRRIERKNVQNRTGNCGSS